MQQLLICWRKLIDIFIPRSEALRELEGTTAEIFYKKSRRKVLLVEENIFAVLNYKEPLVKTSIWQIKYRNHSKITRLLAEILYQELLQLLAEQEVFHNFNQPILIPIPLSAARLKARGYNQSENLAREILKIDCHQTLKLLTKVLTKIKETPPQSSLTRTLRLKNLKNCFTVVGAEKIYNRNVVLIDDVTTTGATLKEAISTMRRAGARSVIAFVLAH